MSRIPTPDGRALDSFSLARRSVGLVRSFARAAGEGAHHLTVVLVAPEGADQAECMFMGPVLDESTPDEGLVQTAFLLAGTTIGGMAMTVLRTVGPDGTVTLMSWAVRDLVARPATAEQSRIAHRIGEDDFTGPSPEVTFVDAPALL
ncbi:hypothetical protein ACGFX2_40020 [Streptomyces goshikiensis]|uniref:hypothetical protein n=1 Tax=Streptomyces goshikiensis TaxID=1942 RepID=UPI0037249BED